MVVSSVTPRMPLGDAVPQLRVLGEGPPQDARARPSTPRSRPRSRSGTAPPARTRRPCAPAGWRRRRRRGSCWGPAPSGQRSDLLGAPPVLLEALALPGVDRDALRALDACPRAPRPPRRRRGPGWRRCCSSPSGPRAPSTARVSISTAVWMVMCSEPVMRAPARGWVSAYSARRAISPGISCSASRISLRPKSARERSATLKSRPVSVSSGVRVMGGPPLGASGPPRRWRT